MRMTVLILATGPDPVADDLGLEATLHSALAATRVGDTVAVLATGSAAGGLGSRMDAAVARVGGGASRQALPLPPGTGSGAALNLALGGPGGGRLCDGGLIILRPGEGVTRDRLAATAAALARPDVGLILCEDGDWALPAAALPQLLPMPEPGADSPAHPDLARLTLQWRARLRLRGITRLQASAPPTPLPPQPWPLCQTFSALADLIAAETACGTAANGTPAPAAWAGLWMWFLGQAEPILARSAPADLWTLGDQAHRLVVGATPAGPLPDTTPHIPSAPPHDTALARVLRALLRLREQGRGPAVAAWEGARLAGLHPGDDTAPLSARARARWAALGQRGGQPTA